MWWFGLEDSHLGWGWILFDGKDNPIARSMRHDFEDAQTARKDTKRLAAVKAKCWVRKGPLKPGQPEWEPC